MKRDKFVNDITSFRDSVADYKNLLLRSRDSALPEIVRNHDEIASKRSELIRAYASLEKYLDKLGNRPRMRDGVNPEYYPVYHNAFSSDTLLRVGPSLEAVEQDLDYALGKLDCMSDEEVKDLFANNEMRNPNIIAAAGGGGGGGGGFGGGRGGDGGSVVIGIPPEQITINHVKNPHQQYWEKLFVDTWKWIKSNVIPTVVIGLILAWLIYLFGWN